ncbi:hypothetical protein O7614_04890 [Micromonospora sp. WMMD961]|uniref:hypothetical protein n=1 Tax=Micromonospora sp. WMMD961 TaxID=3016100 RepID=UPI002415C436|nr:hypothetical protein [Micromonospora sp. WMMD961]MDG4778981.1 hypothetical protein [Micromonospora sp. WMMD961]
MPVVGLLYLAAAGAAGVGGPLAAPLLERLAEKKSGEEASAASPGKAAGAPAAAMLLLAAAGVLRVGGPFAAVFFLRRAGQELAACAQIRDVEMEARILRSRIGLAKLREQARAAGVDPDLVAQGYQDLRDGLFSFDKVTSFLKPAGVG